MSYKKNHPFLVFKVNFKALPPYVWGWIGQIIAMGEQIQGTPLPEREWREYHRLQLARGALASAAIEGNPSTELEALEIAKGKRGPLKYEEIEIHNLLELYRDATSDVFLGFGRYDRGWLCEINRRVLDKVVSRGSKVIPGVIRTHQVGVANYRAPDYACCEELVSRFCEFVVSPEVWGPCEEFHGHAQTALLRAIVAHLYVAWIHPFGDGNGRAARMVEFMMLFQGDLPAVVGFSLCRHYQRTRPDYYRFMEESWRKKHDDYAQAPIAFIKYAVEGLLNTLGESVADLLKYHRREYWRKLLDESFPGRGKSKRRLKALADCLAEAGKQLSVADIKELVPMPNSYENLSVATLYRDLSILVAGGWVKRVDLGQYISSKDKILSKRRSPVLGC